MLRGPGCPGPTGKPALGSPGTADTPHSHNAGHAASASVSEKDKEDEWVLITVTYLDIFHILLRLKTALLFGLSDRFMFQVPGAQNDTKHIYFIFFFTLYLQCHVYLDSHNNDSSFLFNCGVRGEIGQRVHPHSQAVYRWQVQPIRISNSTHAVFGHRVDCAISISKDDGRFLEEKIFQHLRFVYSKVLYTMSWQNCKNVSPIWEIISPVLQ